MSFLVFVSYFDRIRICVTEVGWTLAQIAKSIEVGRLITATTKHKSIDQTILKLMELTKEDFQFSSLRKIM